MAAFPNTYFPELYTPESFQQIPSNFDFSVQDHHHQISSCLENIITTKADLSNNNYETSALTNKQSTESSSAVDRPEIGEQVNQKLVNMAKKRSNSDGSSMGSAQSMEARELKGKKQKKSDGGTKNKEEKKPKIGQKDKNKVFEDQGPLGYVHVRARRGQATDSHSLAERVRREKISERMKMLQALVPGCDKVTGKALILDEIINYVQSLQNQVEFLSMKLTTSNPTFYDFGMDLAGFMVTPERLNSMESPLPNGAQSSPAQDTAFTGPNSCTILDSISSFLFDQPVQIPNILPQGNGQLLWDVDDQRQKLINQSGFMSNNLFSFR